MVFKTIERKANKPKGHSLQPLVCMVILTLILSTGCTSKRLEPNAATSEILLRIGYASAGCEFRLGGVIIVYKNNYCRVLHRGKPCWFKLSNKEYNKIVDIVNSPDFRVFYDDPKNIAKMNRETLYFRLGNDHTCPSGFDDSHAICLDDGSQIPDSINRLMKEMRIIVFSHKGPDYWLIN